MWRYIRLYAYFVRFSISRVLEFRVDFYFRVVMDCVFYAVNLGFFHIIYRHTSSLGGWTEDQAYVFVTAYLLVDALFMTLFSNNCWWLPMFINRGDLDYYLTRPVSSLFFLSFRDFAFNSFMNIVIAAGLMTWALARYPGDLPAINVVSFVVLVCLGVFIHYMIRMMFIIPVFWLHTSRGLDEISYILDHLAERPDQIFGGLMRSILLTILPLALIASVPTHVLFGGLTWQSIGHLAAVVTVFFCGMVVFWNRGLRAYSSASS